jgi:hypothetical protein
VTITSATAGTTVISATSDIGVSGQVITRTTDTAVNTAAGGSGNAEKIWVAPTAQPLTPGYWKNHQAATTALLPVSLGNFSVATFATATAIFDSMNCGSSKPQGAVGCLAGHLLAAELNVANGGDTCIAPVIAAADAFLISINYVGPTGTYTLTDAQRAEAISIKNALDKYNNGGGC